MEDWIAFHLYYHEDLTQAVLGFVAPTVASLLKAGRIDRFFFVRYGLGGPHIRLRLRSCEGCAAAVSETSHDFAARFLDRNPSTARLDPDLLRRQTQALLRSDPHETDDSVYPDNSLVDAAFRPEVERYGGPHLLRSSLDFFTLSSSAALEFLARFHGEPRSRQLKLAAECLLTQALGFAADEGELVVLLSYGVESWGEAIPGVLSKGDRVFESQPEVFRGLFREGLEPSWNVLAEGARRLSGALKQEDQQARKRIGISQLHMTATRLGLSNPEETYLSRLLSRAAEALRSEPTSEWELLSERLRQPLSNLPLDDLLPQVLRRVSSLEVS